MAHTQEDPQPEIPIPRPTKSAEQQARIDVHNRRREYLQRHPSYLANKEQELADPVLYERLVKRFQTADERAAEVKSKGYGRTLEADLLRGETRLAELPGSQRGPEMSQPGAPDIANDWNRKATDKSDGLELWHTFLRDRFVQGNDDDFDYSIVDTNDDYDTLARRDAEDAWFDAEEPSLVEDLTETPISPRHGDTGIQDF
ncbi:hypothetical protein CC79DRAFT_1332707 [Sarocladium strictum]